MNNPEELYYDKSQGIYWYIAEDEKEYFYCWSGEASIEDTERAIEKSITIE